MDKLKTPVQIEMEEGKTYYLCACGHSKKYPLCDGSHRDEETNEKSMPYTADASKTVTYVNQKVTDV